MTTDSVNIVDSVSADTLEVSDQIIVEGELFIIQRIETTDDIDEIVIVGENLTDPTNDRIPLYADDYYELWYI